MDSNKVNTSTKMECESDEQMDQVSIKLEEENNFGHLDVASDQPLDLTTARKNYDAEIVAMKNPINKTSDCKKITQFRANGENSTFFGNVIIPKVFSFPEKCNVVNKLVPDDLSIGSSGLSQISWNGPVSVNSTYSDMSEDEEKSVTITVNESLNDSFGVNTQDSLDLNDSKSRIAVRFLLKKSKRFYSFCGAVRFYLSKSAEINTNKIKKIVSNLKGLKETVKKTIVSATPKSISQITSSIFSSIKGHRIPECLQFFGLSFSSMSKRSRLKYIENVSSLPLQSKSLNGIENDKETYVIPTGMADNHKEKFQFLKPKVYECGVCDTRFYKLPIYLRHIRRHVVINRCNSCNKAFSSVINKRRHQLQCRSRVKP
ncbi:hypothetical protein TKK_0010091 [Trichogramma kaykai]